MSDGCQYAYDIFVSYSRKDTEAVQSVVDRLIAEGYRCWMDISGIESGDAFKQVIVNSIKESCVVLFFSSAAANESKYTVKEINVAVELGKPIIPIRLDNAPYHASILFDLSGMDFIPFRNERGEEMSFEKLYRSLASKCRKDEKGESRRNVTADTQVKNGRVNKPKSITATIKGWGCSLEVAVCSGLCVVAVCYGVFIFGKESARGIQSAAVAATGQAAEQLTMQARPDPPRAADKCASEEKYGRESMQREDTFRSAKSDKWSYPPSGNNQGDVVKNTMPYRHPSEDGVRKHSGNNQGDVVKNTMPYRHPSEDGVRKHFGFFLILTALFAAAVLAVHRIRG